jgi:uncharacterized protein (DUF924 family)
MTEVEDVLSFWFLPKPETAEELAARSRWWFNGGETADREIRERFEPLVVRARRGDLDSWAATPRGTLALIILVDQFSRNLYRGSAEAFSRDDKALALAREGYDTRRFDEFDALEHLFAAMPFQHAEDLDSQRRGVLLAQRHALGGKPEWRKMLVGSVDFGRKHLDVIARFGRFPHRNGALGRESTAEEREYLAYLTSVGEWL